MGVVKDNNKLCPTCSNSIAMLFPASECQCIGGRLAICIRMTVTQMVRPHRPSCILAQLTKDYGDRLLLCGEICPSLEQMKERPRSRASAPASPVKESNASPVKESNEGKHNGDGIMLSGDIESNPGPRRSIAEKGPTTEEKVASLEATLANYEAKVSGLENEIETQKETFDKTIDDFTTRFVTIEENYETLKQSCHEKMEESENSCKDEMNKLREEMSAKFTEVEGRIDDLNQRVIKQEEGGATNYTKIENNFNALQNSFHDIQTDNSRKIERVIEDSRSSREMLSWLEARLKDSKVEYTGKIHEIAHVAREQRREYKSKFLESETEYSRLKERMEMMNNMMDEMSEKMYEFEQNKKNNLIFNGVVAEHPETYDSLLARIISLIKVNISIKRDIPVTKASRVHTGPEVRGCRPVLVTFENFKDRDEVLRKARMLKKVNIHVTEDLSKRTRENITELRKFMRQIKKANPERNVFLQYDKLYIDNKIYVWNDAMGQVLEQSENLRYGGDMMSRPGSMMMGPMMMGPSRPGSRTGSRPASGVGRDGASGVPKLPPLSRQYSMSMPNVGGFVDPREEKLNELERVISQYQEKLSDVTTTYQQKVSILENKIVDSEMDKGFSNGEIRNEVDDYLDNSDSVDLSDMSPMRNPRSNLASAKSINMIREEEETEDDDELLRLNGTL